MKSTLVVSAFLFLIGCTRTKRDNTSTNTIRNFVLDNQEESLSTCAKSIHHKSLIKRALTCSLGKLHRRFLNFIYEYLLRRNSLTFTRGSPINLTSLFKNPKAAGPLLYNLFNLSLSKREREPIVVLVC